MNKKFISSVLAGACALSMTSIAAFAADATVTDLGSDGYASQEVTVTSTTQVPTLKVTVPTTADVVVNPYRLNVTTPITSSDTIISPEYEIKNESDCGVTISATVKATPGGAAAIATKPLKGTETTKSVFMYLETTATAGTYYTVNDADGNAVPTYVEKAVTAKRGETLTAEQEAANAAFAAQLALSTKDTTKDIATLAAGNTTAQSIFFKLQGNAVTAPKTPWLAADKVDVALTLKITPNANAETGAGGPNTPVTTARVTGATATAQGTAITAGNIVVDSTAKTITITSGASVGNMIAVTLTLDTGNTLGTVTATDGSKFGNPTATGNVISGTFIAAGGGFTVLVNNGTDDETWTVTIN